MQAIVILLLFFVVISSYSEETDGLPSIIISEEAPIQKLGMMWKFIPDDEHPYETDFNFSTKWYASSIGGAWQRLNKEVSDYHGIAWYKIHFSIDKKILNSKQKMGLMIPLSYGAYQVYLNGNFVYESGPFSPNNTEAMFGSQPVFIELPKDYFSYQNDLSIRASSYSGWGGFNGFLTAGIFSNLQRLWIRYVMEVAGIAITSIFLFLYFFLHYYLRKKEVYNLFFSGFCLTVGFFIMGYNGFWFYIFNHAWAYWIITFLSGINMYLLPILFIHSFHNVKLGKIANGLVTFYLILNLIILIEYLVTGEIFYFVKYVYNFFNISYILMVLYLVLISIKAVIQKRPYSWLMLFSVFILSVSFLYSMLIFTNLVKNLPLIGEGFFAMAVVFSLVLAKRFAQTHSDLEVSHRENIELNKNLEEKVKIRTTELQEKNKEITESIEYAGLIQDSILPSLEDLDEAFSEHFVIWKPRDIVGGDFYWFHKKEDGFLIALVDCTGHGVPGALLSMASSTILNEIVAHINNGDPAVILKELNRIMKKLLSQGHKVDLSDDGLEIGLCHYNQKKNILSFAGSKIRLFHLFEGELIEMRGDKQGIGNKRSKLDFDYTSYEVPVKKDMAFYMTTDGLLHQNGTSQS